MEGPAGKRHGWRVRILPRGAGLGLSLPVPILQTRVESARVSLAFRPGKEDAQHPPCALSPPAESRSTSPPPQVWASGRGAQFRVHCKGGVGEVSLCFSPQPEMVAEPLAELVGSRSASGTIRGRGFPRTSPLPLCKRRPPAERVLAALDLQAGALHLLSFLSAPPSNAPRSPSAWPPSGNSSSR